ncbi:MAG: exopolysaccharide biosynthesis protein [Devosia sp.]
MATTENTTLGELIDTTEKEVKSGEPISIGLVQRIAGRRTAGPLLLFPALLAMSPITIIPGVPTMVGLSTVLVATQIAIGHEQVWLPNWLKAIKLPERQGQKLLKFLKPIGEKVDAVVKPRATLITRWPFRRIGAALCALVGLAMLVTEVVPFTSTWAGAVIASFALAITVRDGFLALAWACLVAALAFVAMAILF